MMRDSATTAAVSPLPSACPFLVSKQGSLGVSKSFLAKTPLNDSTLSLRAGGMGLSNPARAVVAGRRFAWFTRAKRKLRHHFRALDSQSRRPAISREHLQGLLRDLCGTFDAALGKGARLGGDLGA